MKDKQSKIETLSSRSFLSSGAPARPSRLKILTGFIGGALSISILGFFSHYYHIPLIMAPFGASCVLLFALPESPLAQPRSVIGGHIISTFIGIACFQFIGAEFWQMGIAVGLAIALMQFTRTIHAPAGADPIVVYLAGGLSWSYIATPVALGAVILVLIALIINNIGSVNKWPKYWW